MKALVAFYSGTGNTAAVGRAIAKELGADVEEIETGSGKKPGFLSTGLSSFLNLKTGIAECSSDPAKYDLVVVGTPTYGGKMSAQIRSYIEANKACFPAKVAFFRVGGNVPGNGESVNRDMASLAGRQAVAAADFAEKEVKSGEYAKKAKEFAAKLK
ncbi:MAG: NAD(P)H-dependent oxidoreductase [Candidatus ainarchaeum sp.]|nr:NAD(P)H-dependent oxidoreductase [Candidatus ainarchaeum sp.]